LNEHTYLLDKTSLSITEIMLLIANDCSRPGFSFQETNFKCWHTNFREQTTHMKTESSSLLSRLPPDVLPYCQPHVIRTHFSFIMETLERQSWRYKHSIWRVQISVIEAAAQASSDDSCCGVLGYNTVQCGTYRTLLL
jgi:hypothetical protein